MADTQSSLHGHADWSAIFVVLMQQSLPVRVAAHRFVSFLSFFACKHARNGANNTKGVLSSVPTHGFSLDFAY